MKNVVFIIILIVSVSRTFSQINQNDLSIYSKVEEIGLKIVFSHMTGMTFNVQMPWIDLHKPNALIINVANNTGIIHPNISRIDIKRNINCYPTLIWGKDLVFNYSYCICRYEYDDLQKKVIIRVNDDSGFGPNNESFKFELSYDSEENITETKIYVCDFSGNWGPFNSKATYSNFDNCGNYSSKFDELTGVDFKWEITNFYIPGTCLLESKSVKNVDSISSNYIENYYYNPDLSLSYSQLIDTNWFSCGQTSYSYNSNGKCTSLKYGECNEIPTQPFCNYFWNLDGSLNYVDYFPESDSFNRVVYEYGTCSNVKAYELKDIIKLNLNSPIYDYLIFGDLPDGNYIYNIIDLNGRIIQTNHLHSLQKINLQQLPNGLYFLQINLESKIWTGKFIKM